MNEKTKNCPFCNEEILSKAEKCKHCNEWLTEDISDDEDSSWIGRIIHSITYFAIAISLFYFGGWKVVLGELLFSVNDAIYTKNVLLLKFNDKYYGFVRTAEFFDSSIIQWLMLGLAVAMFWAMIEKLLFDS